MSSRDFNVNYGANQYDITEFLRNHPGGRNYVDGYKDKDVAKRMKDTNHSTSAYYLLREYKVGDRNEGKNEETEDLEKLVDWGKPMLSQVASLGYRYNEWVSSPVDRTLRLFKSDFLEILTITPWYLVPIVWLPVICYYIYDGSLRYMKITRDPSPLIPITLCVLFGIFLWTLVEYSLHRWVFHMEPSGKSKAAIIIHFTIHGLHHKVPFDTRRLVFPPFPAAIVVYVSYHLLTYALPPSIIRLVLGGAILGYVIYDMIHFYLHYGSPEEGTYLYNMKRYHNQHHFVHHDSGFGISNKVWDSIFGTMIQLRKLAMGIKW